MPQQQGLIRHFPVVWEAFLITDWIPSLVSLSIGTSLHSCSLYRHVKLLQYHDAPITVFHCQHDVFRTYAQPFFLQTWHAELLGVLFVFRQTHQALFLDVLLYLNHGWKDFIQLMAKSFLTTPCAICTRTFFFFFFLPLLLGHVMRWKNFYLFIFK